MVRYKLIFPISSTIVAFARLDEKEQPDLSTKFLIIEDFPDYSGIAEPTFVDLLKCSDRFRYIYLYKHWGNNVKCFIPRMPVDYIGIHNVEIMHNDRFNLTKEEIK